ncbi:MAG: cytochrome C, partial [Nitrospinota bacterium]|nr:cytochrome C [Nitrospinota bacterium]
MLETQHDILWTFLTITFTVFSFYVFVNMIGQCRRNENVNTALWGSVFGGLFILNFLLSRHMFSLVQRDQMLFIPWQVLSVFIILLVSGLFFKSHKIQDQSSPLIRGFFFWTTVSVLLAGYTNWLP